MKHHSVILLLVLLLSVAGPAAAAPVEEATAKVDALVQAHEKKHSRATVGVCIADLATGDRLYEHNAEQAFKPASNQKLLTTAFALERLGREFKFTTAVCQLGDDLVVTGEADPLLGDPVLARRQGRSIYADLDRWAGRVRQRVGDRIPGRLLLRTQISPDKLHPPDWTATDHSRWYGAGVSDLNFHDNCYDVTFQRDEATGRIVPVVAPASRFITVRDELKLGKRQRWQLIADSDEQAVTLKGTVRTASRDPLSAPCKNPPLMLGRVLQDRLLRAGVTVAGGVETVAAEKLDMSEAKLLAGTRTPLVAALARANKDSLNVVAECLLLRAGDGTWTGSTTLMRQTLIDGFGLSESLVVRDGSGLSDTNRLCPGDVTTLLFRMAERDDFDIYFASLARSGVDGTLKRRLASDNCRGRVAAKTGYVAGASALSGYILDSAGQPALAFSVIVNGTTSGASRLANRIAAELVDAVE